jgi:hypothetical protein
VDVDLGFGRCDHCTRQEAEDERDRTEARNFHRQRLRWKRVVRRLAGSLSISNAKHPFAKTFDGPLQCGGYLQALARKVDLMEIPGQQVQDRVDDRRP